MAALQFLSVTPPLVRRPFTPQELGRAVGFFPLAGTLLGLALTGLDRALSPRIPVNLESALLLTGWVVVTGALHIDGFVDTLDGVLGGHTTDRRMAIMHDENVGAFGLAGGVLLLVLKLAALAALPSRESALVVVPTLARWGMSMSIILFPYARAEGLGRTMKDRAGWVQLAVATVSALLIAWFGSGWLGFAAAVATLLLTCLVVRFILARIPGLTGDTYGALGETLELALLILFATGAS